MQKNKYGCLFFEGNAGGGGGSAVAKPPSLIGEDAGPQQQQQADAPKFLVGEDWSFQPDWTTKLPEEMGDSRASMAKFKSLDEMAKAHIALEQKLGSKENMVSIPTEKSNPEQVAAYRKAMGVPEKVEDYKLTPEKFPEGVAPWPKELIAPFEAIAHKHNIPPAAMKEFVAENLRQSQMGIQAQAQNMAAHVEAGQKQLQTEWGSEYPKNIDLAKAAARTVGVDVNTPGFTDPNVVKAFVALAKKISDDQFVSENGTTGGSTLTGKNLAKDIQGNPENPLNAKYKAGDADVVAQVRRLNQA